MTLPFISLVPLLGFGYPFSGLQRLRFPESEQTLSTFMGFTFQSFIPLSDRKKVPLFSSILALGYQPSVKKLGSGTSTA